MPYVKTEPVESSNIERIGYLRTQQILRIVFKGGRAYDYPLVTEREYKAFMEADSKGRFFNQRIRPMYGHRNPRPVELVEPCCEHEGSDTCTKECFPCNEFCCPGVPSSASPEEMAAAIKDGLEFGAADHSAHAAVGRTDDEKTAEFAEAYGASPAMVDKMLIGGDVEVNSVDGDVDTTIETVDTDEDQKACLHPNVESLADGSNAVCAACGADLSQSGEVGTSENEEEETNGNSD